ncbi:UDP-glucuronic acid decarboxylase family protein [Reyranella sp.]|uniref:UDP-glucuronic acid decarboxylase family protein n=1 Tax=Reyranella sp. TaxID=1929291 RepID=UPI003D141659
MVVTGGAGFLGSHLCERLVGQGHRVICVDNFDTGRPENVRALSASGRFSVVQHDIVEPFASKLPRFDQIYNLACPASPPHYQSDPVRTALICSQGTYNCLQAAKRHGARFFQASTSEIYGDPEMHPQSEDYRGSVNAVGPRSCYDEGKRFAETLVTDFGQRHKIDTRIARIFNTYGPRMQPDDGRVVSNFIVQALLGRDITIYGTGEQTRSFCFVTDLISGFIRLMAADGASVAPVNLGNPAEITVGRLAESIVDIVGSRSSIVHRPLPIDDPRRRRPDIARAQSVLGWSPKVDLLTGLRETIAYFEEQLNSGSLAQVAPYRSLISKVGRVSRDLIGA